MAYLDANNPFTQTEYYRNAHDYNTSLHTGSLVYYKCGKQIDSNCRSANIKHYHVNDNYCNTPAGNRSR